MTTTSTATATELLDYAGHFYPLNENALLGITLTRHGHPAAVVRITATDKDTPAAELTDAMASALHQTGAPAAVLILTGAEAVYARASQALHLLRRHATIPTGLSLIGPTWLDLDTHAMGTHEPGTSNVGLTAALDHGAPAPRSLQIPAPAGHSSLPDTTDPILTTWPTIPAAHAPALAEAAAQTLATAWPQLLTTTEPSDDDAAQILITLNTPMLLTHTTALATLYPAADGPRTTVQDIAAGMPYGVDWPTAQATDALLAQLIQRGSEHTCIGPLTALAHGAWLCGQGSHAHALATAAESAAQRLGHLPLAAQARYMHHLVSARLSATALTPGAAHRP